MLPIDSDYLVFFLVGATVGTVSLLLLLQVYVLCFIKRETTRQGSQLPTMQEADAVEADAVEAPSAGGGAAASTWATIPSASCEWVTDGEAEDCVVCLSALQQEEEGDASVRVLPKCRHAFHAWCIARWLVSHSVRCPICRTPARPDPEAAPPDPMASSPLLLPPTPLPAPPSPSPPPTRMLARTRREGGGSVNHIWQSGTMSLAEHQVVEQLHLPLLFLY